MKQVKRPIDSPTYPANNYGLTRTGTNFDPSESKDLDCSCGARGHDAWTMPELNFDAQPVFDKDPCAISLIKTVYKDRV